MSVERGEIRAFTDHLAKGKRSSANTVVAYANDLSQFVAWLDLNLGSWSWTAVTHREIRAWAVSLLQEHDLKEVSLNRKLSSLRTFFNYLLRNRLVQHNPAASVSSLKLPKRVPQFLEAQSLERLFDEIEFPNDFKGRQDRLMLELLYVTGMRRSELLELNVGDLTIEKCEIKVLGKRNKERIIPVSPLLTERLEAHLACVKFERDGADALFINGKGKRVSKTYLYTMTKSYLRQVSSLKKVSPHVLRHTFATQMLANGADLNAIKEMLGHANLAATQVYTHTTIDRLKKIHEQAHPRA